MRYITYTLFTTVNILIMHSAFLVKCTTYKNSIFHFSFFLTERTCWTNTCILTPRANAEVYVRMYCDQCVCLSVCLLAYLKNHESKFHRILCTCYMWLWLDSPLKTMQCLMYFNFYPRDAILARYCRDGVSVRPPGIIWDLSVHPLRWFASIMVLCQQHWW